MGTHFATTCGTSVASRYNFNGKKKMEDVIKENIDEKRKKPEFLRKISAETNSLQALGADEKDHVTLITTDTNDGAVCAEAVKNLIKNELGCSVTVEAVEGLQVYDADVFRKKGVSKLFEKLSTVRNRYPAMKTVLNVTGGFKAVVPYMVLYGLFNSLEMTYLFERSEQLIKLPPAPLGVDFNRVGKFIKTLYLFDDGPMVTAEDFRKLRDKQPYEDRDFFESLFYEEDGYMFFSAFGEIVIDRYRQETLSVKISKPALKKLRSEKGELYKKMKALVGKLADPSFRNTHIDAGWSNTELTVTKPGNVAERAAYYIKAGVVYACELFTDHENYKRELKGRKIADYRLEKFTDYTIEEQYGESKSEKNREPESEDEVGISEIVSENQELKEQIEELKKEREKLVSELKEAKNKLKALKKRPRKKQRKKSNPERRA